MDAAPEMLLLELAIAEAPGVDVLALVPDIAVPSTKPKPVRRRRVPGAAFDIARRSGQDFALEPHVCRICFGRVVSTPLGGEGRAFRCTNCGAQGQGQARTICACGAKIGGKDAGLRCIVNAMPTPENPSEIVAKEGA